MRSLEGKTEIVRGAVQYRGKEEDGNEGQAEEQRRQKAFMLKFLMHSTAGPGQADG